jgi:hypothetical protein
MHAVQLAYDTLLIFPVGLGPWPVVLVPGNIMLPVPGNNMAPPPGVQVLVLITPGRESLLTSCGCVNPPRQLLTQRGGACLDVLLQMLQPADPTLHLTS